MRYQILVSVQGGAMVIMVLVIFYVVLPLTISMFGLFFEFVFRTCNFRNLDTISCKIFEANSSFYVK